nr:hypothetical protein CFP56_10827 [Quercus suber]
MEPFVTLNADGSSNGNPGNTGGGGVICTHTSQWIKGSSINLGITTKNVAELEARNEDAEPAEADAEPAEVDAEKGRKEALNL